MKERLNLTKFDVTWWGALLTPLLLFWGILYLKVSPAFSQYLHSYSLGFFLLVLALFFVSFQQTGKVQILISLGLTMALFALTLSYLWSSGWSDNGIIGGLLPYKDAKNYYFGANLILNGIPVVGAQQASERPLFPAFLASVLFLTGNNLKITIAFIVQLMGLGLYLSARQIRYLFGALAASLYAALIYYIQPLIGDSLSESLGFAMGCFGFALILTASLHMKLLDLIIGLITLLVAVSARAGTFIVFPLLAIWVGWITRGQKRFSLKTAAVALTIILVGYFLVNSVYSRFLGIPPGASFRNFSYALYGQVRGGTGWHSAIVELGTRDPIIVYRATFEYFLAHPTDVVIGFAKAYRDFFLPGALGIFPFLLDNRQYQMNVILWLAALGLVILGLLRLFREVRANSSAFLLAGFIGVFLSIPFLPPRDGGTRFYASTVPFIFAVAAVGHGWFSKDAQKNRISDVDDQTELVISRVLSSSMLVLTLMIPLAIYVRGYKPAHTLPVCPSQQKVFVIEFHPGTYIDLVKADPPQCGFLPGVCLSDFEQNNTEKSSDDFYQKIFALTENDTANVRIIAGFDLVAERLHYYYISHDKLPDGRLPNILSGCATPILTANQSIFQVESLSLK